MKMFNMKTHVRFATFDKTILSKCTKKNSISSLLGQMIKDNLYNSCQLYYAQSQ